MQKVVLLILCVVAVFGALVPKQLAGPPSEFATHAIPSPKLSSLQSRTAILEALVQDKYPGAALSEVMWSGEIFVETPNSFGFSVYAPENCNVVLRDPNGNVVDLSSHENDGTFAISSYKLVPTVTYVFSDNTLSVGTYTLEIVTSNKFTVEERQAKAAAGPFAFVTVLNNSPLLMHSYLSTYNVDVGKKIGLTTLVSNQPKTEAAVIPEALKQVVTTAWMDVFLPDGAEVDVPMYDDGLHDDGAANDGIFAGSIIATEVGPYRAMAVLEGQTADGVKFMRTSEHIINVIDTQVTFDGSAVGEMIDSERMAIHFGMDVPASNDLTTYRAYSEVWGKDSNGNDVAICWISSIAPLTSIAGQQVITLELNLKWVTLANAQGPFTLKNAFILDPYTNVPVDLATDISLKTSAGINSLLKKPHLKVSSPTKEMKQGKYPAGFLANIQNATAHDGGIVLVHGYCSDVNPWSSSVNDFSNAYYFLIKDANIGTHKFAELVDEFAASKGLEYYSVIGHSQGGMVGAHLHNYFFTGMDKMIEKRNMLGKEASSSRLIQTLGSPFSGCSGAGFGADLAYLFGYGCGCNYDLTTDGASIWLSGITAASRAEVFYYTTTYELGTWFGDYCSLATNLVLSWPNDGVTELYYAEMAGGNYLGNTERQCHTTDLGYMAHYLDHSRNQAMSANAAR